ncbi:conserved hypothetical protein [Candidatus Blochmanniella vafra str. BVAF]|uniref:Endoribonuclease YbeY n=1 Tax=Blochmanniella vafra (strain BVAF) TaxID=859654 RepID=E8Q6W9_BLOVB|nr:rRNA maturation RNase YbeY [Candidatus Blochmannia vafer]ADV33716.1 conserved hypothetical protein [Candidatus Blochmannia vafer str. BVAF]
MANKITLNLQIACTNLYGIPNKKIFQKWIKKIFFLYNKKIELTIRIVDIQEMLYLNWYYAGKKHPTNVLSFPFKTPLKGILSSLLGDIVICKQIIEYESKQYNISSIMHWAHMIIHGSLHLLGYDHILNKDAELMHQMELNIMQKFGYHNYYFFN